MTSKIVPISDNNHNLSKLYYFNSSASSSTNTSNTNLSFALDEAITIPSDIHVLIAINQIQIPLSMYVINNTNDVLGVQYTLSGTLTTNNIKLPRSNPNATVLSQYLTSMTLSGLIFTYDEPSMKMNIVSMTNNFSILSTSTCLSLLGFTVGQTVQLQSNGTYLMVATNLINLTGTRSISLRCFPFKTENITFSKNIMKSSGDLLAVIPITQSRGSVMTYIPSSKTFYRIIDKLITRFDFGLYDSNTILTARNGR